MCANKSDALNLFENSSVSNYKMIVNSKDVTDMVAESTGTAPTTTTSGSTSLTGSDGMMVANAVIVLMFVLWHIRHH